MTKHTILKPLLKDQWLIESQELPSFVPTVQEISACTLVYRRVDNSDTKAYAQLQVTEVRRRKLFVYLCGEASYAQRVADKRLKKKPSLQPDDVYCILPPDGDIHAVKTTSQSAAVSIHLLGNDTACVLRHQFIRESYSVKSFRSGYSNALRKQEEEKEYA
ncbi:hypothetical protein [Nostoc sp.]|uniref:hypothetical protein n=1 Tax=Nostoc sp. TaxID=1180 RepID=UPI0035941FED